MDPLGYLLGIGNKLLLKMGLIFDWDIRPKWVALLPIVALLALELFLHYSLAIEVPVLCIQRFS